MYLEIVHTWTLKHANIIPLLGITHHNLGPISLVTPWMKNGTVTEYLAKLKNESSPTLTLGTRCNAWVIIYLVG